MFGFRALYSGKTSQWFTSKKKNKRCYFFFKSNKVARPSNIKLALRRRAAPGLQLKKTVGWFYAKHKTYSP